MAKGALRHHRDFRLLWGGETVSELGSQVSLLAIPLLAVRTLHATTIEMGLLTAASTAAFLVVGLPAGAWVDRMRKRRVMIGADVGRMLALGSVPIAYAIGDLTLAQLFVVTLASGILTVFFDVAYQSYLPSLVGREHLVEGNAKLAGSAQVADGGRAERRRWSRAGHRQLRRGGRRLGELRRLRRRRRRHPHPRAEAGRPRGRAPEARARHRRRPPASCSGMRSSGRLRPRPPPPTSSAASPPRSRSSSWCARSTPHRG